MKLKLGKYYYRNARPQNPCKVVKIQSYTALVTFKRPLKIYSLKIWGAQLIKGTTSTYSVHVDIGEDWKELDNLIADHQKKILTHNQAKKDVDQEVIKISNKVLSVPKAKQPMSGMDAMLYTQFKHDTI